MKKAVGFVIPTYSKAAWFLSVSLPLLTACGTEVGNGKKPPEVPDTDNVNTAPESASPSTSPDSQTLESQPFLGIIQSCSSPVSEMKAAVYRSTKATVSDITVTLPEAGTWTVSNGSNLSLTIQSNATTELPYAIKSTSHTLAATPCTSTTTVSTASGFTRTALYTNNSKTEWMISSQGAVTSIRVLNASGTVLAEWTVNP